MNGLDFGRGFVGDAARDLAEILVDGFCDDVVAVWRWLTKRRAK